MFGQAGSSSIRGVGDDRRKVNLLFYSKWDDFATWAAAIEALNPNVVVSDATINQQLGKASDFDFALVWDPPSGLLASLPNLKCTLSLAAGIAHITKDEQYPANVPIEKMVDEYQRDMMAEWAMYAVLHYHRGFGAFAANQQSQTWNRLTPADGSLRATYSTGVGVLGLGYLGMHIANSIQQLGFKTHGWSRTQKGASNFHVHHGKAGLQAMLPSCHMIVCALPLTPETTGMIDAAFIASLPRGAYIINQGRGGIVVEEALLKALDDGHLGGAFLDVFETEPLPAGHAFWGHPKITVTPHIAGDLVAESCAKAVCKSIAKYSA